MLNKGFTRLLIYLATIISLISLFSYTKYHQVSPININSHHQSDFIITDLEIKTCFLFTKCQPSNNPSNDWYQIPKPLNFNNNGKKSSFLTQQYLFIKKIKLSSITKEIQVIHDLQVSESNDDNQRWSFKRSEYDPTNSNEYVYNIDVLFGLDAIDPRPDWKLIKIPIIDIQSEVPIYLTLKTSPTTTDLSHPKIQIPIGSNYKILQVADLHFSTNEGTCRDQYPEIQDCKADKRTLKFLETVLDSEKPDLVLLTGDQIFGDDSFESYTTILKALTPFITREIPYALMMGNHDDEGSVSRQELMEFIENLPYSLAQSGPEEIDGFGNYIFTIKDSETQKDLLTFYVLDSHKYSTAPKVNPGYDWIKPNQLSFLESYQQSERKLHENHLSFALFHIPLPEYKNLNQPYIGNYKESVMSPNYNSFARDFFTKIGVSIVTVGHDHCNDYCLLDSNEQDQNKIWLCYGGAVGEGGYAGYGGTTRRLRIFQVDTGEATIKTFKKLETDPQTPFDEQTLVLKKQIVNFQ
ncbi:hypothetical protein BN7_1336 [Wickerhamomyces ciferrii]|uniref:Calcineurin-like phosphoesterase domain-containing protein n=1 Tax=Wickerhamomyces ciferrii (strain ATCC 14091 / BCRC 22168 / CBS 111 / JCM 3599 / NBRC 0793 / NRRL Y-1031 F-60-10) TaxID=1206466 RepID=K0KI15_WICCF|nr:uncharacterized protein BN7_1336 [Wickerhamomyces ciferrii]CCH41797.1 hypothetical protein BN7_1336 [Wickerhamomyces ciferrii]